MNYLVTGASGFIGRYVITELLERGYSVSVVTRDINHLKGFSWYKDVKPIIHDFNERCDNFSRKFGSSEGVIHLAWQGLPNYFEKYHLDKNLPNDIQFLSSLIKEGVRNLTIAGTCFEYGLNEGMQNEDALVNPVISYAIAKDCLRRVIQSIADDNEVSLKWLRLFYMYGEGQSKKSILELLRNDVEAGEKLFNMSLGEQIRDYSHVKDISTYIVSCATQNEVDGIINCCSGKPISLRRFIEQQIIENGYDISLNLGYYPYVSYEPLAFWGERNKLNRILSKETN